MKHTHRASQGCVDTDSGSLHSGAPEALWLQQLESPGTDVMSTLALKQDVHTPREATTELKKIIIDSFIPSVSQSFMADASSEVPF